MAGAHYTHSGGKWEPTESTRSQDTPHLSRPSSLLALQVAPTSCVCIRRRNTWCPTPATRPVASSTALSLRCAHTGVVVQLLHSHRVVVRAACPQTGGGGTSLASLQDVDARCTVCQASSSYPYSTVLSGRTGCPTGLLSAYTGYLCVFRQAARHLHQLTLLPPLRRLANYWASSSSFFREEYICVHSASAANGGST